VVQTRELMSPRGALGCTDGVLKDETGLMMALSVMSHASNWRSSALITNSFVDVETE